MNVKRFVTHKKPHLDELVGIWLLVKFGESLFPGVAEAWVEFWDRMPDGKNGAELEENGLLLIGIGGGRFDEHPTPDAERKKGKCAATLVAEALGLEDDPALKALLDFTVQQDLTLGGGAFNLHTMIKMMYGVGRDDLTVQKWTFEAIAVIYEQGLSFFEDAATDFVKATVLRVQNTQRKLNLVVGRSDSEQFAKFARSPHGCGAGVVVQKNSHGNVQVQTRDCMRINMRVKEH